MGTHVQFSSLKRSTCVSVSSQFLLIACSLPRGQVRRCSYVLLNSISVFAFGTGVLQVTLSCSRVCHKTLRISSRKCVRDFDLFLGTTSRLKL
jgi:hypothetical protein